MVYIYFLISLVLNHLLCLQHVAGVADDGIVHLQNEPYQGPTCGQCNTSNVWNDVIYLIESSVATQQHNVGDVWTFVLKVSESFNIQKKGYANPNYMQVGVITFSDQVQIISPLGTVDYNGMRGLKIPYMGGGEEGTNILEAIRTAERQFSSNGRVGSRKVIVLLSVSYRPNGELAPKKEAITFQENGGIFIVYDYTPYGGTPIFQLRELASAGYFFFSGNSTVNDMVQAYCDANCFCSKNYVSFISSERNTPLHGCYYAIELPASYKLANRNCQNNYNNFNLASVETLEKQLFMKKLLLGNDFLLGLRNLNGKWIWADGQNLGDYHPWVKEPLPSECLLIPQNSSYWLPIDCRQAFWYVCEGSPCSSNQYCKNF